MTIRLVAGHVPGQPLKSFPSETMRDGWSASCSRMYQPLSAGIIQPPLVFLLRSPPPRRRRCVWKGPIEPKRYVRAYPIRVPCLISPRFYFSASFASRSCAVLACAFRAKFLCYALCRNVPSPATALPQLPPYPLPPSPVRDHGAETFLRVH